ncbi:hypothetical protein [Flavobacterium poyangense]|uniref:hypothetical protein n=1 Tax=Flavobacterium poyangense TaxID=2204302 RepID=UPI00141E6693|nr:hypothetical protein [Flavobacterium sp. JXAS1]
MQKENQKASKKDVVPSVVSFLSNELFEGELREQPLYLQEIFELMLETEYGNNLDLRLKMLSCLRSSRNLAETLSVFSDKQIHKACVIAAT